LTRGITSTVNLMRSQVHDKAQIVCELTELPEVECVLPQLNQVLMNMLINAKQTIQATGKITISTSITEDGMICISISDTGQGISPENMPRIFDAFYTTKPVGQGTGLGLSLSYSIIQKHHGRIEVDSTVGVGTRFNIFVPILQPVAIVS